MRFSTIVALGLGFLASTWTARPVHADSSAGDDVIIARVGEHAITAGELARRISAVPPFQLRSFGRNAAEVRKGFLDKVLIREALLAQGAIDAHLGDRDDVKERIRGVLRGATLARVRTDVLVGGGITEEEVKHYFETNASKFHAPPRIAIWRIQVAKREEALAILAEMKKDASPKRWNELARDRSIDKVTGMRGGNLGFVAPDGSTAEPGFKVEQAIVAAAAAGQDAEILPEPVKDGDRWSVVWRRQSMKAVDRPMELEAPSIRQVLTHEKTDKKITGLLEQLRKDQLHEYSPELVDLFDIGPQGELQAVRRPGALPSSRRTAAGSPAPLPGPGGALR